GGRHGADHDDVAVREIDEADDAVHHRVAQRDQRVDAAQRQAIDELLYKDVHRGSEPAMCSQREKPRHAGAMAARRRCCGAGATRARGCEPAAQLAWLTIVSTISHLPFLTS